ncbi:MAG: Gfo/Idh/MocA family oxidoreductase [Acidobacteriota bacterium]|nr:MAG: Gfo/Idh/MocA family oxidoreductase [Acidobacteriota bacterium]
MKEHRVGVILNGVTGRMGKNQHLIRSILAIRKEGGLAVGDDTVIIPEPLLVGRNPAKLSSLAAETGVKDWTTDLDEALSDGSKSIYFDSQLTALRVEAVTKAVAAGKHIYCEKPTALNTRDALELYRIAREAGVKQGVVQDKLWLPGMLKLKGLIDGGFFGRILSVRGEFGYWVFEGDRVTCQRPSWNYRKEDGGGIIYDMFPHWRYLLDNLFGGVKAVSCVATTHIERRWDERDEVYDCTADDAAYSTFVLKSGAIAHFNSSWCVRVRRDDLLTVQVDGTEGTAIAGLRHCWMQPYGATPRPVWNPDIESPIDYRADWMKLPEQREFQNAFRAQWELFLRHVVLDQPFTWDLLEGARGVQLAEKGMESWKEGRAVEIPEL